MADEKPKRPWSIEEIEAYGRDDLAAALALERGIKPGIEPDPEPNTSKSDNSWQDEWRQQVKDRRAAAYEILKRGGS
ncbi:MAG: hypothetical protein ACLQUT_05295 [Thermoleophilia bacterium]